jgi:hypothetical protein
MIESSNIGGIIGGMVLRNDHQKEQIIEADLLEAFAGGDTAGGPRRRGINRHGASLSEPRIPYRRECGADSASRSWVVEGRK